jgi:hypothetical protein
MQCCPLQDFSVWETKLLPFRFSLTDKTAILNVDKKLLENALGFDKDNWPGMADATWGSQIFSYYGYKPYWDESATGTRRDRF